MKTNGATSEVNMTSHFQDIAKKQFQRQLILPQNKNKFIAQYEYGRTIFYTLFKEKDKHFNRKWIIFLLDKEINQNTKLLHLGIASLIQSFQNLRRVIFL